MVTDTVPPPDARAPLLQLRGVTKSYPGVLALDSVDLELRRGEIHALLGENGAGKSTLIRVIAGVHPWDRGDYLLDGQPARIGSPRDAFSSGISVVHQERNLIPTFSVGENVLLDRVIGSSARIVGTRQIERQAAPFLKMVGLTVSPSASVSGLSAAQRQLVEIARGLSRRARILLLDEPTASLSIVEATDLLATIRRLRDQGVAVVFVSHKLEEVFDVCEVVTVLRDGRTVASRRQVGELDREALIALMVGRGESASPLPIRQTADRPAVLEVRDRPTVLSPNGESFTLHEGEILGWYGLVGAGRTELARAVVRAESGNGGEVVVGGRPVEIRSPADALRRGGIGYVTENRQEEGLFLDHSVRFNIAAASWHRLQGRLGLLSLSQERRLAERFRHDLEIRTPSVDRAVSTLSGGNRQKVSVAKWVAASPAILFVDEPTVGIDVITKQEIHELIRRLADDGISIVLISSDLPEMVRLADRILVFKGGRIIGEVANSRVYEEVSTAVMSRIVHGPAQEE